MSISTRNRRFSYLGTLAVAGALSLAALSAPLSSANAQGWVGFQVGPFGFGVGTPGYGYPYYPTYRPYGYYNPAYYYPPPYYPGYYYGY
jgi:hypothetical protein